MVHILIVNLVEDVLYGYHCTVFAYGQTGTGKSFTIEGTDSKDMDKDVGMITRTVYHIFDVLRSQGDEFSVKVSHLELYNETISDLLANTEEKLKIFQDPSKGVLVHNLAEVVLTSPEEIHAILASSLEKRQKAETEQNDRSSRSHCVFTLYVHIREKRAEGTDIIKFGKLNFVDLAGSENITKSGSDKVLGRRVEASRINQGVLALGRVIISLTQNTPHIPYRESRLTRLLQDALGGNNKTCMIATISPSAGSLEETMSTLEYASKALRIVNTPSAYHTINNRKGFNSLMTEIDQLKRILDHTNNKQGISIPREEHDAMQKEIRLAKSNIESLKSSINDKENQHENIIRQIGKKSMDLDKKNKRLETIMSRLSDFKQQHYNYLKDLQDTKGLLETKEQLILEYIKTEEKIHNEIKHAYEVLKMNTHDIDSLIEKIQRLDHLEHGNGQLIEDMKFFLFEGILQIEGCLKVFLDETTRSQTQIKEVMMHFFETEKIQLGKFESRLNHVHDGFNHQMDTLGGELDHDVAYKRQVFSQIEKYNKQVKAYCMRALSNAFTTIHHILDGIVESIQNYNHNSSQMLDYIKDRSIQLKESLQISFSKQLQLMGDMTQTVNRLTSDHHKMLKSQKKDLDRVVMDQREDMKRLRMMITDRLSESMNALKITLNTSTQSVISQVIGDLEKDVEDCETFDETVRHLTSTLSTANQSFYHQHTEHCDTLSNSMQSLLSQEETLTTQLSDGWMSLSNLFLKEDKSLEKHGKELDSYASSLQKDYKSSKKAQKANLRHLNQFGDQVFNLKKALLQELDIKNSIYHEFGNSLNSGIDGTLLNTQESMEEVLQIFEDMKQEANQHSVAMYMPTGMTPVKKEFEYPKILHTVNYEDILNDYRIKRKTAYTE